VFHTAVELVPYGCKITHAPPGGWIQNWYCGFGQPPATPLSVTRVPGACGAAGLGVFHVLVLQGDAGCNV
jgi:hypothetical protein